MPPEVWTFSLLLLEMFFRVGIVCLVLLRKRGASSTMAWVTVVIALPLVGSILYLLIGEVRLGRSRIRRHREIVERIESSVAFVTAARQRSWPTIDPRFAHLSVLAHAVGGNDPQAGNRVTLMGDTDLVIESLVSDINQAASHCHLLFYIFLADMSGTRVGEALIDAARRGVACRVLVDGVGSKGFLESDLRRRMEAAGVRVVEALKVHPLRMLLARIDLRNHRKIAVIDGVIGYTGSQNIADAAFAPKPRFAPWVDAMARVVGPLTWDLQVLFVEDWFLDTDESLEETLHVQPLRQEEGVIAQVMATGPNAFNEALRQMSQSAFHTAREELFVTTPYFVPDEATLAALCTAARRGVDTRLIVPARNDSPLVGAASRAHYDALLACGVRIFEFRKGLLHAKTITVDRDLAVVSTANLDRRSFELNFEVSLIVYDDDFASQLRFLQTGYLADSVEVDRAAWERRMWPGRLWSSAAGLVSPLL